MNPNSYTKQNERGLKRKLELIKYKGCKCEKCGYDKNISAKRLQELHEEVRIKEGLKRLEMEDVKRVHIYADNIHHCDCR